MQLADALTLDAPRRTADGYLAVRARAARSGVYDYQAADVGAPDKFKPTDTVKIYRDEADVFAADAVKSFIGRPITNDHPREAVTAANWRDHARGVTMGALRDGDYLAFDLTVFDAATIAEIEAGKRELSNGYQCQLDWTPGTAPDGTAYDARQTSIRGNHVAVVDRGRAGPNCAIKDGERFALCDAAPSQIIDGLTKEPAAMPKTMLIDGLTVDISNADTAEATIKTLIEARDAATGKITDLQTQVATLTTDRAALESENKQLKDSKPTPADLRDAAKKFAQVADKAKALGVTVTDEMDEAAIMRAAVDKHVGDAAKEWTEDQVAISFATLKDTSDPVRDALRDGVRPTETKELQDAYSAMVDDLTNAWKPKQAA